MTTRREAVVWFAAGLAVYGFAAAQLRMPGYMDADYYFATSKVLVSGGGFQEPFLWNYLGGANQLPQPSHLYWMPFASLLAASGQIVLGDGFRQAQILFVIAAAALPPLSWVYARGLNAPPASARMSAILALVPGFFAPFLVTTDTFAPFALAGAALLYLLGRPQGNSWRSWTIAGLLLGIAHLTRVDGILLAVPVLYAMLSSAPRRARPLAALAFGYLVVMAPWMLRNLMVMGALLPSSASRTLWLLSYDELFTYSVGQLTFARWWSAGVLAHLQTWLSALSSNIQTLVAVNGLIVLTPFALIGLWHKKDDPLIRMALLYAGSLFLLMTVIFPFAGARGGYFHSSAALMPLVWAAAPIGLSRVVGWAGARRRWDIPQAERVFSGALLAIAIALTAWIFIQRVVGLPPGSDPWSASARSYVRIGAELDEFEGASSVVAVNNPPGFYLATGRPAIVIPDGPPEELHRAVLKYEARWVVLEPNHPAGLDELYAGSRNPDWLRLRAISGSARIYEVVAP